MTKKKQDQESLNEKIKENIHQMDTLNKQAEKNKKELSMMATSWRQSLSNYKKEHTALIDGYREQLEKLAAENMVLYDLPDSIDNRLAKTAPIIGKNLLDHLENKMDNLMISINASTSSAATLEEKINMIDQKIEGNKLKRFLVRLLFVTVIASVIAGGVSYAMLSYYPTRVMLNKAGNVSVYDSQITLWKTENLNTNKTQLRVRR